MAVELVGEEAAARAIDSLVARLDVAVTAEARQFAESVASRTAGRVPHDSGRLAASLAARPIQHGAEAGYLGGVPYAAYVEFGGSHGRPYVATGRYLYPTAAPTVRAFVDALERATAREIERYPWPKA